uniref:ANK_REP_REGION domain-containing protein n=1 Tax=Macrostomum lignano TaxID=282301 RepID=A0A1I8JLP2_9PLAT
PDTRQLLDASSAHGPGPRRILCRVLQIFCTPSSKYFSDLSVIITHSDRSRGHQVVTHTAHVLRCSSSVSCRQPRRLSLVSRRQLKDMLRTPPSMAVTPWSVEADALVRLSSRSDWQPNDASAMLLAPASDRRTQSAKFSNANVAKLADGLQRLSATHSWCSSGSDAQMAEGASVMMSFLSRLQHPEAAIADGAEAVVARTARRRSLSCWQRQPEERTIPACLLQRRLVVRYAGKRQVHVDEQRQRLDNLPTASSLRQVALITGRPPTEGPGSGQAEWPASGRTEPGTFWPPAGQVLTDLPKSRLVQQARSSGGSCCRARTDAGALDMSARLRWRRICWRRDSDTSERSVAASPVGLAEHLVLGDIVAAFRRWKICTAQQYLEVFSSSFPRLKRHAVPGFEHDSHHGHVKNALQNLIATGLADGISTPSHRVMLSDDSSIADNVPSGPAGAPRLQRSASIAMASRTYSATQTEVRCREASKPGLPASSAAGSAAPSRLEIRSIRIKKAYQYSIGDIRGDARHQNEAQEPSWGFGSLRKYSRRLRNAAAAAAAAM